MPALSAHKGCSVRMHPWRSTSFRTSQRPVTRCMAQATALKKLRIKPPSSSTAATELEALSKWSTIIPDTVLMQKVEDLELQAATVSSTVLAGMMGNPRVSREYQASQSIFGPPAQQRIEDLPWHCRWLLSMAFSMISVRLKPAVSWHASWTKLWQMLGHFLLNK